MVVDADTRRTGVDAEQVRREFGIVFEPHVSTLEGQTLPRVTPQVHEVLSSNKLAAIDGKYGYH